jgi:hypothetical protein
MRNAFAMVLMTPIVLLMTFAAQAKTPKFFPHIMPDAPSSAYQGKYLIPREAETKDAVNLAIKAGERNMAWLKYMNSFRPEGKKIQLTKPGDLQGIPIDTPKTYSPKTIETEYQTLQEQMPAEMTKILYGSDAYLQDPPVAEDVYIQWARKVDKNYQTATRWTMMKPYLSFLAARRENDLRGYYWLAKKDPNVEGTLRSLQSLPADRQTQIKEWLVEMCQNLEGLNSDCATRVEQSVASQKAYELYLRYVGNSEKIWNNYFSLENPRSEFTWSAGNPNVMTVPFQTPSEAKIQDFLSVNIEDEWKWGPWKLQLSFITNALVHVEFEPGATPHVNEAGGDTITMDDNAPLTEWDVQWTIRHEFGHVLGFVDCYEEFYDPSAQAIITYQLDITHLMCARSGRMQQGMFDTLKKFYYR